MSKKFRPAASTSTITSTGLGSGSSTSSSFRASLGSPSFVTRQARTVGPPSALDAGPKLSNRCPAGPAVCERRTADVTPTFASAKFGLLVSSRLDLERVEEEKDATGKGRYEPGGHNGRAGDERGPGLGH